MGQILGENIRVYLSSDIEENAINSIVMIGKNEHAVFERKTQLIRRVWRTMSFLSKQDDFSAYMINSQDGLYKIEIDYDEPYPIGNLYFSFSKETDGSLSIIISHIEWTYIHDKTSWWYEVKDNKNVRYPFLTHILDYRRKHPELFY